MLVKATLQDIEKYGNMVYELALNPAKSGYPTYADGIKTKEDFLERAAKAAAEEDSELLLFALDGNIEGWITYFWIPGDEYLQLTGCNINLGLEQALGELLALLESRFKGYTLYFGFPFENQDAVRFLQSHGFQCIEKEWNHSFFFDSYHPMKQVQNIEKISDNNFHKFRAVYHTSPETYWNCDRILETLDNWTIFVYNEGETPAATVFLQGIQGHYEIFGMNFADGEFHENIFRELMVASLNECKRVNAKFMTYFCQDKEKHILSTLGFRCVGQYVLYIKTLPGKGNA